MASITDIKTVTSVHLSLEVKGDARKVLDTFRQHDVKVKGHHIDSDYDGPKIHVELSKAVDVEIMKSILGKLRAEFIWVSEVQDAATNDVTHLISGFVPNKFCFIADCDGGATYVFRTKGDKTKTFYTCAAHRSEGDKRQKEQSQVNVAALTEFVAKFNDTADAEEQFKAHGKSGLAWRRHTGGKGSTDGIYVQAVGDKIDVQVIHDGKRRPEFTTTMPLPALEYFIFGIINGL